MRSEVLRLVIAGGMRPVLAGLTVGLLASVAIARALRGVLFGVAPVDPLALGAVVVVLLASSAVACYLPARRAAALDPAVALRSE